MAVIETVRGVTTRVLFLPVILTRFQEWNALLPESPKACQHYYAAFVKALLNGMVSARARALPENSVTPNGLGLSLTDIADAGYNRSPGTDHQEIFCREKSRAWAEAWGAALAMALIWALASVAASPLPMLLQWGWLLAWRSLSEWQLASASVCLLLPQQRYRPDPNHTHC